MSKKRKNIKRFCLILFVIYLCWLLYFTIFAESLGRIYLDAAAAPRYNLRPFTEIKRFLSHRQLLGSGTVMLNIAGNVLAFMPCGLLLPVISARCKKMVGALIVGLSVSFLIECTQLVFRVGSFDVDDLMLNTAGVLAGYLVYMCLRSALLRRRSKRAVNIRRIE